MSEETNAILSDQDSLYSLDGRAVLLHYNHIKISQQYSSKCTLCRKGVDAVVTPSERYVPEPVVRESPGADEEEAAALPLNVGWDR